MVLKSTKTLCIIIIISTFSLSAHAINFTFEFLGPSVTLNPSQGGSASINPFDKSNNITLGDTNQNVFAPGSGSLDPLVWTLPDPIVTGVDNTLSTSINLKVTDNDNTQSITKSIALDGSAIINANNAQISLSMTTTPIIYNFGVGDLSLNALNLLANIFRPQDNPLTGGEVVTDANTFINYGLTESEATVPEPASLALIAVGLVGISLRGRKSV